MTPTSPVGSYPISVSQGTLAASNYSFVFHNGTLQVTPATLTVSATGTQTYGASSPTLTPTYSGFVNGDSRQLGADRQSEPHHVGDAHEPGGKLSHQRQPGHPGRRQLHLRLPQRHAAGDASQPNHQLRHFGQPDLRQRAFHGQLAPAPGWLSPSASSLADSTPASPATPSPSSAATPTGAVVTIDANQAGNGNYNAAPQVDQSFTIAKANQTIMVTQAAAGEALPGAPCLVWRPRLPPAYPWPSWASGPASGGGNGTATITITGSSGTAIVTFSQAGNANYNPATMMTENVTIIAMTTPTLSTTPGGTVVLGTGRAVDRLGEPGRAVTTRAAPSRSRCTGRAIRSWTPKRPPSAATAPTPRPTAMRPALPAPTSGWPAIAATEIIIA